MSDNKTYSPELLPRQGEITAWLLTLATAAGVFFLIMRSSAPYWAWFLLGLFAFSAASISFGNWMDRNTRLHLTDGSVEYENGLRKTKLAWSEIQEIRTSPARWGTSVQVIGEKSHFSFSTLGKMQFQGKVRGMTGFAEGDQILSILIQSAGLTTTARNGELLTYSRA